MKIYVLTLILLISAIAKGQFVDITSTKNFESAKSGPLYGSGVSAADYDNDGDIDLYICTGRDSPDYLYQNNDGNFISVGESIGLSSMQRSRMALWMDIDADADLDLLVAGDCHLDTEDCFEENESNLRLYRQENGIFTEITNQSGLARYGPKKRIQRLGGLAAADINGDGFIDFIQTSSNSTLAAFINKGNGVFEEKSMSLGLETDEQYYWQPFFHDFNSDGYIDLYCNVDFDENQLFMNNLESSFEDWSKATNSNHSFNEMGISLGDIDNDGDFDIYATNSENYLGNDVYNVLLQHNQTSRSRIYFTEIARDLGVEKGGWGWGTTLFDSNNNGLLDIATTNGWSAAETDQSKIWIQQTDRTFSDQSHNLGFNDNLNGTTLISLDYDRDGDLDMIQSLKGFESETVPIRLLENTISKSEAGHYLVVKPRMSGSNHYAIGATVTGYADGNIFTRIIHAGTSFYGQEPAEAFLGLGQHIKVDSLNVTWPGGEVSWWYNMDADQILTLDDSKVVHRPGGFKVEQVENEIFLSWYDVSLNESGFRLQRSTSKEFDSFSEKILPANTVSYVDSDASTNTIYFYRLMAYNDELSSRFTDVVEIENIVLSIAENSAKDIFIYPNPTLSVLNVRLDEKINFIELIDMSGSSVSPHKINFYSDNSIQLELGNLQRGIYILKTNTLVKRIIVK